SHVEQHSSVVEPLVERRGQPAGKAVAYDAQAQVERRQVLADSVVQLTVDVAPFGFLGFDEPPGELLQSEKRLLQVLFGALPIGTVDMTAPHTRGGARSVRLHLRAGINPAVRPILVSQPEFRLIAATRI